VRIPRAAWKPATSSASVNGRTRTTSRPAASASTASVGGEHDLALRRARRRRDTLARTPNSASGFERRVQQRVEGLGVDRRDRLALVEQPLVHRVAGEPHRGLCGPLRVAGLEH
jgi:hypothetical protein